MSEEQLAALLAKLKDDAGLQKKLKGAADLDAVLAIAKEAGFAITAADLLRNQAQNIMPLSDAELESVVGGGLCVAGSNTVFGDPRYNGTQAACDGGQASKIVCFVTAGNDYKTCSHVCPANCPAK